MKHLTASEVLQFVDASADYATMAFCTNHLAVCEHCRRQVEIQRSLTRSIRRLPLIQPSSRFTDSVMRLVHPSAHGQLFWNVVNNLGAIFGLVMVLSAGGILYDVATKFQFTSAQASPTVSQPQPPVRAFQDLSKRLSEQGNEISKSLPLETVRKLLSGVKSPILWSSIMVLLLLLFDQFFSKRAIRNIQKLKPQ